MQMLNNLWKTPLYTPHIKTDTTRYNDNGNYIKSENCREIDWLQTRQSTIHIEILK